MIRPVHSSVARLAVVIGVVLAATAVYAVAGTVNDGPQPKEFEAKSSEVDFAWIKNASSTTSTEFEKIPGLSASLCGSDGLTATVSLELEGAPGAVRLRLGEARGARTLHPGQIRFAPPVVGRSGSTFNFGLRRRGLVVDELVVEWRSLSGAELTMHRGTLTAESGPLRKAGCL
jgi:hypothetical protein